MNQVHSRLPKRNGLIAYLPEACQESVVCPHCLIQGYIDKAVTGINKIDIEILKRRKKTIKIKVKAWNLMGFFNNMITSFHARSL